MRTLCGVAFSISLALSQAHAAGTVNVYLSGDSKAKTLTNAAHLIDVVGQPRLAQSWWPGAVISERQATAAQEQRQQSLLAQLDALAAEESGGGECATPSAARDPRHGAAEGQSRPGLCSRDVGR